MTRYAQLDGLRGLAALAVVFAHTAESSLFGTHHAGTHAVRLFFVLSGFLITGILLSARRKAESLGSSRGGVLRAFYLRRTLRIFPVYYLALAAFLALGTPGLRENAIWAAGYASNLQFAFDNRWHGAGQHLWSLAVEEQFYLLWPALCLFLPTRLLPLAFGLAIICGPAYRAAAILLTDSAVRATLPLPGCVDCLAAGALLSWVASDRPHWWPRLRWPLLLSGVALVALAELTPSKLVRVTCETLGVALCSAWLVGSAARGLPGLAGRLLESRPLVFLGTVSYGLYLYHVYLLDFSPALRSLSGVPAFLALLAATLAVASVSWFAFEKPLNALKDRFPYTPQPGLFKSHTSTTAPPASGVPMTLRYRM